MVPILASEWPYRGSRVEKGLSENGKAQGSNYGKTCPSAELLVLRYPSPGHGVA